MSTPTINMGLSLQQLFNHGCTLQYNPYSRHIFKRMHQCHTPALGMHHYKCDDPHCNHIHQQYHSCGNRHCPNCGGLKKEQWVENLLTQLFPTAYYHVVFTLPHEFNPLMMGNRKLLFNLLFESASATLLKFSVDPKYLGATCGITTVLHTWGQDLSFHPHLHCIVSGGGIKDGAWVKAKRDSNKMLFPVTAMSTVYKAKFLEKLKILLSTHQLKLPDGKTTACIEKLIKKAGYKKWNVYAKSPFGSVANVVEYLGRYTHKVAITKHRILDISEHSVTFKYKDYSDGNKQKTMTLSHVEFLRRFEQHFLPKGYVKIRHFGLLQNHGKTTRLNAVRKQMDLQPLPPLVIIPVAVRMLEKYGTDISQCPKCKKGKLHLIAISYPKENYYIIKPKPQNEPALLVQNKAAP
jgi:hypothetical protein